MTYARVPVFHSISVLIAEKLLISSVRTFIKRFQDKQVLSFKYLYPFYLSINTNIIP